MKSRQTSNTRNQFIFLVAIFIVAILFWRFFPTPISILGEHIFKPLIKSEAFIYQTTNNLSDTSPSEKEELEYLKIENEDLKNQLNNTAETLISAGVIGRPTALPYDVLVIDKGESDGITENTPVYADNKHVIGFVAKVYKNSAIVNLITTPGFTSTVYVYGPNIYTTGQGMGGGVIRIHVPQGINIDVGNVVIVPSLSSGIFGTISVIDSIPSEPEQYGYVTSQIPINSLRQISVGTIPLTEISFEEARQVVEETKINFLQVPVPEGVLVDIDNEDNSSSTEEILDNSSTTEATEAANATENIAE